MPAIVVVVGETARLVNGDVVNVEFPRVARVAAVF
jgi:hypothetical protein